MASESLRTELEAGYKAYFQALQNKDPDAFAAAACLPEGAPEDEFRAEFAEATEMLLGSSPDPSQTQFVAVKTLGDDLAGYYCTWVNPDNPKEVAVVLTPFRKTAGGWKVSLDGAIHGFELECGEDLQAKAKQLLETEPMLQLQPADSFASMMEGCDTEVSAVLECSAYDYEVTIAVNGVALDWGGGSSFGQRLFGVVAGGEPGGLGVLRVGENRIDVAYRKTEPGTAFPLTVEVHLPPAGRCFRLVAGNRPSGSVNGTFEIPKSPTEGIRPEEIRPVEITDDSMPT